MKEKTFTDTALSVAMVGLAVAWVVTMVWVTKEAPWLRTAHVLFFLIAIFGVSAVVQARADRRLDEVELAAARFGARWGLVGGVALMSVLVFLPSVPVLLDEIASAFGSSNGYPRSVAARMFLLGIVTTFVAQETFRTLFAAAWRWSKR